MPREKPLFRQNLDRLDKMFPDTEVLKYKDIVQVTGRSMRFVQNHYKQYYKKELAGISKSVLASILS